MSVAGFTPAPPDLRTKLSATAVNVEGSTEVQRRTRYVLCNNIVSLGAGRPK